MTWVARHRVHHILLVALTGLCVSGCVDPFGPDGETPPPGETVKSDKAREISPVVPASDLEELVAANSAFAFDLYQQVRDEGGNLFYSPYSISTALAMTYAGARNETEQQMADTLHFTLPQDRLHPAFNKLDLALASRGEDTPGEDGEGFKLNIVNRIWGQTGYSFLPEFLDVLAVNYAAGLSLLDFVTKPEESRLLINDWVSDQTEDKIKNLIPEGVITSLTRLVLTNAIYFNAAWAAPFEAELTRDRPFNLLDGSRVTVPMMTQVASFKYAAGDGYQAVELPYEGNELSMVIFLPDADRFDEFEGTLGAARVETILQDLSHREMELTAPKFTFEWATSLKNVLSAMGMPVAFSDAADFSGMNGVRELFLQDVIHKAFVKVDEEGTEAAAATAVIVGLTAAPSAPLVVTIDRPFVFLIRDIETGALLFVGRVLNPST
jgi:serpin B